MYSCNQNVFIMYTFTHDVFNVLLINLQIWRHKRILHPTKIHQTSALRDSRAFSPLTKFSQTSKFGASSHFHIIVTLEKLKKRDQSSPQERQ